jgi:hypothetical protein
MGVPSLDHGLLAAGIAGNAQLRERGLARVEAFAWQRCAQQTLACVRTLEGLGS